MIKKIIVSDLSIGDLVDDNNINKSWEREALLYVISKKLKEKICIKEIHQKISGKINSSTLNVFIDRVLDNEAHYKVGQYISLSQTINEMTQDKNPVLFVERSFYMPFFKDYIDNTIKFKCKIKYYDQLRVHIEYFKQFFSILRHFFVVVKNPLKRECLDRTNPKIGVGYQSGVTNRVIPFLKESKISLQEMFLCSLGSKIDVNEVKRLQEKFQFIDLNKWQPNVKFLLHLIRSFFILLKAFDFRSHDLSFRVWLYKNLAYGYRYQEWWREFFREYNIKVWINHNDQDILLPFLISALEENGGIWLNYQFSGSGFDQPMETMPMGTHLFCAWGKYAVDNIIANGMLFLDREGKTYKSPKNLLIFGHLGLHTRTDHSLKNLIKQNIPYCKSLIGVFDTDYDLGSHFSKQAGEKFYEGIFEAIIEKKDIGLIIKPKGQARVIKTLSNSPLYSELLKQKRVILLSDKYTAFDVFAVVDMVVAGQINSVCIEAAMISKPHVYFDTSNWKFHMFYNNIPPELIAKNRLELEKAINSMLQIKSLDDKRYKDYTKWTNPFDDGNGTERLGFVLGALVQQLKLNNDINTSLEQSLEMYKAKYGDNFVIQFETANKNEKPIKEKIALFKRSIKEIENKLEGNSKKCL